MPKRKHRITFIVTGPMGEIHRFWQQLESQFPTTRNPEYLETARPSLMVVYLNLQKRTNDGSFSVHTTVSSMSKEWENFLYSCERYKRPHENTTILVNKEVHEGLTRRESASQIFGKE